MFFFLIFPPQKLEASFFIQWRCQYRRSIKKHGKKKKRKEKIRKKDWRKIAVVYDIFYIEDVLSVCLFGEIPSLYTSPAFASWIWWRRHLSNAEWSASLYNFSQKIIAAVNDKNFVFMSFTWFTFFLSFVCGKISAWCYYLFFFQIILTVSSSPLNRQRGVLNAGGDNIVYT